MKLTALATTVDTIRPWRVRYVREMNCQVVHDSLHARAGWTRPSLIHLGNEPIGYGSVVHGGPWADSPAVFEFYLDPPHRNRAFEAFEALLQVCHAVQIDGQSNDVQLISMLLAFAHDVRSEKVLFEDGMTTGHVAAGAAVRAMTADDAAAASALGIDPHAQWVLTLDSAIVGGGGILCHYNAPYNDLFMMISATFRRRGLGTWLVQELKRICQARGNKPVARCSPSNAASIRTLQKAGMVPFGHMVVGELKPIGRS